MKYYHIEKDGVNITKDVYSCLSGCLPLINNKFTYKGMTFDLEDFYPDKIEIEDEKGRKRYINGVEAAGRKNPFCIEYDNYFVRIYRYMEDETIFCRDETEDGKTLLTVSGLIEKLKNLDGNKPVFVCCQGYTNFVEYDGKTRLLINDKGLFITDNCFCEQVDSLENFEKIL